MKKVIFVLVAGIAVGVCGATVGQDVEEPGTDLLGAFFSKTMWVFFDMPIELDGAGKLKAPRRVSQSRELVAVPDYYGRLIEITQYGNRAVFWYQDDVGEIRNVVFDDVNETLMRIERRKVTKLRFEVAK